MKNKLPKVLLLLVPLVAALGLMLYLHLADNGALYIPCPFLEATGYACPGCGATRCVSSLLLFRLGDAVRYNVLMVVLAFAAFIIYLYNLYSVIFRNRFIKINNKVYYAVAISLLVFALIRNLPFFPFKLSPHGCLFY